MNKRSKFVISLDFELHWGVFDKVKLDSVAKEKFIKTREVVIPQLLALFSKYKIKATWATVGFLFAKDLRELESFFPILKPEYSDGNLNPYKLFNNDFPGISEAENPYHFANSVIRKIKACEGQEIGSHSFSHFYCLEEDVSIDSFEADIISAKSIAKSNFDIDLKSFVFPRNQFNEDFLSVLKKHNYKVVRSNPEHWSWDVTDNRKDTFKRIFRLLDTYFVMRKPKEVSQNFTSELFLNEGTRFFRPYSAKITMFEKLKIRRIKKEMELCARKGYNYHLWWHPHNFAVNTEMNLMQLESVLQHFHTLSKLHQMENMVMSDLSLENEYVL